MKLKVQFSKAARQYLPPRQMIRTWTQQLPGTRTTVRALAMAERPKSCQRHGD
jgi:hypothetical protein